MTHIDTIIAEIRNSLKQYDTSGLIDDLSLYNHTFHALRKFGNLITSKEERVIKVLNGRAELPKNFQSIQFAQKVDKCHLESQVDNSVLQKAYFWKERTEQITDWNRCEDCSKEYSEKRIVEKIYFNDGEVKMYYKNPRYLKISKHTNREYLDKNCHNKNLSTPYELTIKGNTLYTNFPEGDVFIRYNSFEMDEDGKPYIPDTPQSRLETYLTYYLKRKIFEDIWLNSDDTGIESKIQYLLSQENQELSLALTDIKAASLTMRGFYKLDQQNRRRMSVFEYQIA